MKTRLIVVGLLVLLLLCAGFAYVSPYLTVTKVRKAGARGDAATVNAHVDFPALRQSVKGWMGAAMAKRMLTQPDMKDNPLSTFGALLAMTMIDRVVEAMVTPEAVRMMLEGQPPRGAALEGEGTGRQSTAPPSTTFEWGYEAYDRFTVKAMNDKTPKTEFTMVWLRSGLTWKLSELRLPPPLE